MIKRKFFIHCYISHGWKEIYDEIISAIPRNQTEIVSVVTGDKIPDGIENGILIDADQRNTWEFPTIRLLKEDCLKKENELVDYYYLHLKGITHLYHQPVQKWRKMMLYFLTRDVDYNSMLLENYDAIGCNFCPTNNVGNGTHFSGNFWATRQKHVSYLSDIGVTKVKYGRLGAEFWIGESSRKARYFSFHQSDVNHYITEYMEDRYIGTSDFNVYEV